MIYTGYYAKLPSDMLVASISNSQPPGCEFPVLSALVPPWDLVSSYKQGTTSWDTFKQAYLAQLDQLPQQIWDHFSTFPGDLTLACWEAPGKPCHRHILREYMLSKGIPAKEYSDKEGDYGTCS